jgi:hypothetical protein
MELSLKRQSVDSRIQARSGRHLAWLISFLLVLSLALTDAAVVAWLARVVNAAEILAGGFTFVVVSWGALVTIWQFGR